MTQFVIFHISNIKWYESYYNVRKKILSVKFIKICMLYKYNTMCFIIRSFHVVHSTHTHTQNYTTHFYI